eukprot:365403-Chlamydomonas_euryale.AAC.8
MEGFTADMTNLRKMLASIERKLHEMRLLDGVRDRHCVCGRGGVCGEVGVNLSTCAQLDGVRDRHCVCGRGGVCGDVGVNLSTCAQLDGLDGVTGTVSAAVEGEGQEHSCQDGFSSPHGVVHS